MMSAAAEEMQHFDRVELHDGEARRTLTHLEFFEVPLGQRVRWLLSGSPRFFLGEVEVPKREALRLGR